MYQPSGAPPPYSAPPQYGPTIIQPTIVQPVLSQPTAVQAVIVTPQFVGSNPAVLVCRACNAQIVTRLEYRPAMRTHLTAALLCLIGCWPCVCLPYCMESCNNIDHYCPNCSAFVGSYVS